MGHHKAFGRGRKEGRPQTYWSHDLDLSRSCDIIEHVTIGYLLPRYHFLLVGHRNRSSVYNHF